ncbi:proprotein convertase subtilisin/kexin type 1 inhibitor, like [Heptranchias perlo]|uniref:proprotein convertase subtilisin/kexin type 1 inhibitor, like n=1 Tax=Heptranchias perlo TaxID=212740 RepID=UPI003559723F
MVSPALCSLLLSIGIPLSSFRVAKSKPLSAGSRGQVHEEVGASARFRRDALPYEGEMFAYPPGEPARNEAYYPQLLNEASLARLGLSGREREQMERLGLALGLGLARAEKPGGQEADERLGQALQQLAEDSRRRDQEAAYLSNLLRAWNELGQPEAEVADADLRNGYLDYDEPSRPAGGANRKLPELGRYGNRDSLYNAPGRPANMEEPLMDGGKEAVEEQVMRYLVGRILANMEANGDYPRPVKHDLLSLAEPRPNGQGKRVRRALDESLGLANLVRVKRLGSLEEEEEEEEEDEEDGLPARGPKEAQMASGLQRMKRLDGQFKDGGAPVRSRRYIGYQGAERVIKFLPD